MALVLKDRVKETTTTTGTGTLTLLGASTGYQSFAAIGNGNTCYYAISSTGGSEWEVGIGTYSSTGPTLSRDTILESSTGGGIISLSAGTKDVYVVYPAEKGVWLDAAGNIVQSTFTGMNVTGTATINVATLTSGTVSTTPSSATDIANKQYVDNLVSSGITYHAPVRVESPTNLNATYNNGSSGVGATLTNAGTQTALVIDGITLSVNDRVLVYTQTNQTQNGVYVVTNVGSGSTNWVLTRASDANTYGLKSPTSLGEGDAFFVQQGVTGAGETYVCNTVGTITFGTTNITFTQISSAQIYSAGTGLNLTGVTFSVANTGVTAQTYGNASQVPQVIVNAQGQITSATNVAIAITASNVSGLAASATTDTTNASNITSGTLANARTTATATNGANTIVARDATGNFAAGAITAVSFSGDGSSLTALNASNISTGTLANARTTASSANGASTIVARDASGNFAAATITATTFSGSHSGSGANLTNLNASAITTGTIDNARTSASSTNGASTIVARDASGNFTANVGTFTTITGAGSGITGINASNITSGVLDVAEGGTGLTSLTAGRIPFGAGTSAFGNSADLFWDSANARLGIGTNSPTTKLQVSDGTYALSFVPGNDASIQNNGTSSFTLNSAGAGSKILFRVAGADRATIDASGNLGLGVTPSAWGSGIKSQQIGNYTALTNNQGGYTWLSNNAFYDTSWKYLTTNRALYYSQDTGDGGHKWFNAPPGTAGNAITFTQAMTLDASGNLGIGTTSPGGRLHVTGSGNTLAIIGGSTGQAGLNMTSGGAFSPYINWYSSGTTLEASIYGVAGSGAFVIGTGSSGTERMRITSVGNVGIGTSSPSNTLGVKGATTVGETIVASLWQTDGTIGSSASLWLASNGDSSSSRGTKITAINTGGSGAGNAHALAFSTSANGASPTEKMRIDSSGNVGIGTSSPTTKLDVLGSGDSEIRIRATSDASLIFSETTANKNWRIKPSVGNFYWQYSATAYNSGYSSLMVLDSSGNLGLGVTPSASSGVRAFEILNAGNGLINGAQSQLIVTANAYFNSGYKYGGTGLASSYSQFNGVHSWHIAPSGTAGTNITFTQAMTLDASGNLLVGTTSSAYSSANRGVIEVNGSSDSLIALKRNNTNNFYIQNASDGVYLNNTSTTTPIIFNLNGAERMRIASNGALGFSGANYGTAGQALVSNGSGSAPSWQNVDANKTSFGLFENAIVISANYTIANGNNAISAGPITVNSGVTVTVPSGSVWTVV